MRRLIPYEWFEKFKKNVVVNEATNTTEIGGNAEIDGDLKVNGELTNEGTLLWTNPSPSSNFTARIEIPNLKKYKYFYIEYKIQNTHNATNYSCKNKVLVKEDTTAQQFWSAVYYNENFRNVVLCRSYKLGNDNFLNISSCRVMDQGTTTINDAFLIPIKIYGSNNM